MKIEAIRDGILQAGDTIKRMKPDEGVVDKEGRGNFVTAADLASERILIETIQRQFPTHQILSEETESNIEDILAVDNLWVIDPIDGTSNFRFQRGYVGISVGYVEKGTPIMGLIYNPFSDEFFYARKGEGAFINDRQIQVSQTSDLAKATIMTDNSYNPEGTRSNLEMLLKLRPTPWILIKGSAVLSYCDVAAGRVDLTAFQFSRPWDNTAGFLIAQEAGALVKDWDGAEIDFLSPRSVVGNPQMVGQFIKAVNT